MIRTPSLWLLVSLSTLHGCSWVEEQTARHAPDVAQHALDALVEPAWANQVFDDASRISDVAERTVSSVVHIASSYRNQAAAPDLPFFLDMPPQGPGSRGRGAGSGVLVDSRGLILTNNHVIDGADTLRVTLGDGRSFDAEVKGADPATDLALVQLLGDVPTDLPAMQLGDSDRLRLGQVVLAIGSPFELQGTVTMGIVSARGRAGFGLAAYEDYIQTDAAINPGNSGGALVDLNGQLVGINTAIRSRSGGYDGISFAIPSNLAKDIMDRLVRDGRVVRGYLGVGIGDLTPSVAPELGLSAARGALVSEVMPGTPAAKAGLETYDVIVGVDGEQIDDANDLRNTIALKGVEERVELEVVRKGRSRKLTAVLGELPSRPSPGVATPQEPLSPLLEGVEFRTLDGALRQRLEVDRATQGVLVAGVAPGSDAAEAGLMPGDVIVEVDRRAVGSSEELTQALDGKSHAMLRVLRRGSHRIVVLD